MKVSSCARIINTSSAAQDTGKICFDDIHYEKKHSMGRVYCQSKLANVLFTIELPGRIKNAGIIYPAEI